jgi:nicotinamidase-related amidase
VIEPNLIHNMRAVSFTTVYFTACIAIAIPTFGFVPPLPIHTFNGVITTSIQPTYPTHLSSSSSANDKDLVVLDPLNPSTTAFVMIEYQNEFCTMGGKFHDAVKDCMDSTNMLPRSIQTVEQARSVGCTIIHCPINFEAGHAEISKSPYGILAGVKTNSAFTAGSWGADFVNGMKPAPGDLVVKGKSGLCGFASTNLDFLLRQNSIQNVVLGGFLTNCCVESTMRAAYEYGYKVYTLSDCVAATSIAAQDATLQYNFGMFSIPTTSAAILQTLRPVPLEVAA